MGTIAVAFPVLPGKSEDGRRFAQEATERQRETSESFRRMGITRESWYLQSTPQGDLVIVYMEADDPLKAFQAWAASTDPYDQWFKQRAASVCGIDFNQPLPALPEQVFHWAAG
ncbi:MAG TPA: DUF6176 family protein [Chloroflexota bacterium]|nr:DUF6176 family protein [Chloroflexota bacterium]